MLTAMAVSPEIRLATRADAPAIARMSRDLIECGLGWSWTVPRVLRSIADAQTNAVVLPAAGRVLTGFGIMKYLDDEAHLLLLAVHPAQQRRGTGSALVAWLEASAQVAGIGQIYLEARVSNLAARAFYRHLGYQEIQRLEGYYSGREASVRLARDLRVQPPMPGPVR